MLKELHDTLGPAIELLIFPSDEFGGQELPTSEIPAFVAGKGLPTNAPGCHLLAKVKVSGGGAHPVWKFAKEAFPGDVKWNFDGIFLFDKSGKAVNRTSMRKPPTVDQLRSML